MRRKMEIYNLMATAAIMKQFSAQDFPDYKQISDRIDEMNQECFRERYLKRAKEIPAYIDINDMSIENMVNMYIAFDGFMIDEKQKQKRRRLITDVVNDNIVQYYEDTVKQDDPSKSGRMRLLEINRQSS